MTGTVFVNYRRADSSGSAGRLHADLARLLGPDRVFRDVLIGPGEPVREHIERMLDRCDVLIAVIGPQWSSIKGADGTRRLDDPSDLVRREIARALQRPDVHVIPVLVDAAKLPPREELPADLVGLRDRNAFEISDSRWDFDVGRIHESLLERFGQEGPKPPHDRLARAAGAMTAAAAAAALVAGPLTSSIRDLRRDVEFERSLVIADKLGAVAERLGYYAAERAVLWALIVAVALTAAALTIGSGARPGGVAGRAIVGLAVGALAGAFGALLYITLMDLPREAPPTQLLQALHLAVTGLIVAGSFARLIPAARPVDCRLAGLIAGALAGALTPAIFGDAAGSMRALAFALQAVLVVGAIGIVLAATHDQAGAGNRSTLRARPRWVR